MTVTRHAVELAGSGRWIETTIRQKENNAPPHTRQAHLKAHSNCPPSNPPSHHFPLRSQREQPAPQRSCVSRPSPILPHAAPTHARRPTTSSAPRQLDQSTSRPSTHTPSCVSLTHATLNNILCVYGMTQSVGVGIRHDYSAEAATAIERFSMFCASTYDRKERPLVFSITCW